MDAVEYRRLFTDLPLAWVVHDGAAIKDVNQAAVELFGERDAAAAIGRPVLDYVHPDWHDAVRQRLTQLRQTGRAAPGTAERMLRPDGRELWIETVASETVVDGRPAVQVLCWDVTSRVLEQERLSHEALHDRLTGLPNRALLEQRWRALLGEWSEAERPPAALFCDLNQFKRVNDTHGHLAGDSALRAVAARLRNTVRPGDTLGRFGGDEFVVLLAPDAPDVAPVLADRLVRALDRPLSLPVGVVRVGVSVGLAAPAHAEEALDTLLHRADHAMYEAKRRARDATTE